MPTNWELSESLSNTCTHMQGVMDSESHDGSSLSIPLVLNQKQNEIAEAKAGGDQASTTTTGFFKTCINGLNALTANESERVLMGVGLVGKIQRLCSKGLDSSLAAHNPPWLVIYKFNVLASNYHHQFRSDSAMEAKQQNGASLIVPLMHNENHHEQPDVKSHNIDVQNTSKSNTTSFVGTRFIGINALSGVGILSVPFALSEGGWLSLILLFVIASAAFYSGLLMQRCMDTDSDIMTYPDIGYRAFGNIGRILVSVFMYVELYMVATGFLILEGDNLYYLFPNTGVEIAGIAIGGKQIFVIVVAVVILPSVWLDNLSLLSYISASGVLASVIILGSILWTGAFDGIGFDQKGTVFNWNGIPTAVSLFAFCYCAHPVFPTLYTSMNNKRQFSNVLLVCFILCTISYASMAVFGYLMFGSNVQSQITLNLPIGKLSSRVAIYTTLVNPIAKYALMVTPLVNATRSWFPYQYNKRVLSLLISTCLVISTVIVALAVPFFAYLMSLVGAFLSVSASIILPCLCYLKISDTYKRFGCEMVIIWGIILTGVAITISGTYISLLEIIHHL